MSKSFSALALIVLFALSACGKKDDDKSPGLSPEAKPQVKFEMPKVKYPAAIVFEGGKGDPWFDKDGSKHTPTWRLYICLEKTTQPISGQVVLDFAKLGNPIELAWETTETKKPLYTERLNKVLLTYTYTTELTDTPETNYGYAYGKAAFRSNSTQDWELIFTAPNYNPGAHSPYMDEDLFNLKIDHGSLSHSGQKIYPLNGTIFYISNWLERFTYSEKDRMTHVIEVCEKNVMPIVWQYNEEIKRN